MRTVLVFNAGSATLKWKLFSLPGLALVASGSVERVGLPRPFHQWRLGKRQQTDTFSQPVGYWQAVQRVVAWLKMTFKKGLDVELVGHRFVHGGPRFQQPLRLTTQRLKQLAAFDSLAPLHNPVERAVALAAMRALPKAKQVAVFDTAYFASLPQTAVTYALPRSLSRKFGLWRYGFHGISHAAAAAAAAQRLKRPLGRLNLITIHLGSGCSVTAVKQGRPVDTSMGFTPLEGLVMMTRSGDLDAGVLLHLLDRGWTARQLRELLFFESGIKGLTGSSDFRDTLHALGGPRLSGRGQRRVSRTRARAAFDLFIYRLRKYIGAYSAVLGHVDAMVFTGAIGERSARVRQATLKGLIIPGRPRSLIVPADEELAIARTVRRFRH